MKRCLSDSLMLVALIGAVALMAVLYGLTVAFGGGDDVGEIGSTDPLEW